MTLPFTTYILQKKSPLIKLIWLAILFAAIFFIYSIFNLQFLWKPLGLKAGSLAAALFILILTPGILKRFRVTGLLQDVQIILMAFRRQLGILMYLSALFHSSWVNTLPKLAQGLPPIASNLQQLLGIIALSLTLPLFLTSNDFSRKKLGPKWNTLHKLVYAINWLVFAHIALLGRNQLASLALLTIAIFEIISFAYSKNPKLDI